MDRWLASVLIFIFCVGVGYLWNSMMAKRSDENGRSRWSPGDWFSGVTFVTVVGVAAWLGSLPGKVDNLDAQVGEMRTDMRAGFSTLNNEVFQSDNSLKIRASRTEDELKRIGPRIVREDYDAEIARLNQELEQLRAEYRKLQEEMRGLIAALKK